MPDTYFRDIKMDMNVYEQNLKILEEVLSTGPYSRSFVEKDLQTRKAKDRYSTMGSSGRQTYELSAKKKVYEQTFDNWVSDIDHNLNYLGGENDLQKRLKALSKKVRQQIEDLRSLVREY